MSRLSGGELQRRAIGGALTSSLSVLIVAPITIATNILLARTLHPQGFGVLALYTTAFITVNSITDLGTPVPLIQRGAMAEATGDTRLSAHFLSEALGIRLAVQFPALAVLGWFLLHSRQTWLLPAFVATVAISMVGAGGSLGLISQNRTGPLARIALTANVLSQAAAAVAALAAHDPDTVWLTRLFVGSIIPASALFLLTSQGRRAALRPASPLGLGRQFWRFSFTMWLSGLATMVVYSRTEVFALQLYHRTEAVGLFALAYALGQQLTGPVDALAGALFPASVALLGAHAELAKTALIRSLRFSSLGSGGLLATVVPGVFFAIPLLYGPAYAGAAGAFLILAVVSTLQTAVQPVNQFLFARRLGKIIVFAGGVALILDISIALIATPLLGLWAAVLANSVGQVVSLSLYARSELRLQGLRLPDLISCVRGWMIGVFAALLALGVGLLLPRMVIVPVLAGGVGLVLYLVSIRAVGGVLSSADDNAMRTSLPPRLANLYALSSRITVFRSVATSNG